MDHPLADAAVTGVGEVDDAVRDALLEMSEAAQQLVLARLHRRQVRRQDPQRFDQREYQRQDYHPGDVAREFAGGSAQKQPWQESQDGCQHAENDRLCHQLRPCNGGIDSAADAMRFRMDTLAHYDGVVHHDAQHQQEGESGQHVQ